MLGQHPLVAGFVALVGATVLTWRLNRACTFEPTLRSQSVEAMRYGAVTLVAQGASYAMFAVLVTTVLATFPQAAIVAGAAFGALISYNGHRLFVFAWRKPSDLEAHALVLVPVDPRVHRFRTRLLERDLQ
jgi:putative flippase GtrA